MPALTNRFEDDDAHYLPPGMKRVGYDEKTERYTFRQGDELWLGEPGSFYGGTMKWAGKAPDTSSPSSDDDDYDTDSSESCSDSASLKKRASGINDGVKSIPYLQESNNEWGVPIASVSDTNAKPPDTDMGQRRAQLKKVAKSTVTAIRVTRQWSKKKGSLGSEDQGKPSDRQEREPEKKDFRLGTDRFSMKELPILPAD